VIPGLRYLSGYLGEAEHDETLATVGGLDWHDAGGRRIQYYGHWYNVDRGGVYRVGDLPGWAAALAQRLQHDGLMPYVADQLIVSEYQPGQGIRPHVDAPLFEDVIVGVALGSTCVMEFTRGGDPARAMLLEPRSALVLSGEARQAWRHAIPARDEDQWQGRTWPRGRRVSLTFRKLLHSGEEASTR
jgi:alkylated DNA repair dioxygenase AlkB